MVSFNSFNTETPVKTDIDLKKLTKLVSIGFILFVILENMVNQTLMVGLAIYIPEKFSSSSTAYSMAGMFNYLGKLILMVPLAKLSDRFGRKRILITSFSLEIIGVFMIYTANSLWLIMLGRFFMGTNAFAAVVFALINDYYPESDRGRPISWFSSAMLGGYLLGAFFGGPIYNFFGQKNSFLISIGFLFIALGIIIANIHEHPQFKAKSASVSQTNGKKAIINPAIFWNRKFVGGLLITLLGNLSFLGAGTYWTYMIINYYKISPNLSGLYFIPPIIGDMSAYLIVGTRKNLPRVMKIVFIASFISLGSVSVLFLWDNIVIFTLFGIIFGVINCSLNQANDTLSISFLDDDIKGEAMGIYKLVGFLGGIFGPLLYGIITDFVWELGAIIMFPLMIVISFIIYRGFTERSKKM
jgi:MFS transporter, DHA1 family, multidrug resistance protein